MKRMHLFVTAGLSMLVFLPEATAGGRMSRMMARPQMVTNSSMSGRMMTPNMMTGRMMTPNMMTGNMTGTTMTPFGFPNGFGGFGNQGFGFPGTGFAGGGFGG